MQIRLKLKLIFTKQNASDLKSRNLNRFFIFVRACASFIQCEHMYGAICESVTVIVMSNDGVAKCNNELSYNPDNVQKLSTV